MPFRSASTAALCCTVGLLVGCGEDRTRVVVVHADALARPLAELKHAFEAENPDIEIAVEPIGSVVACRRLQSGVPCDVVALADPQLFDEMLAPKGITDWYAGFAGTEMVLIKSAKSRFNAEINSTNWYEVITRRGVKVGCADPTTDPCGYWTRIVWKLADLHYGRTEAGNRISEQLAAVCTPEMTRPDSQQLIQYVQGAGGWDYAFVYKAQADQLRVDYVPLPPQINLGSAAHAAQYAKVSFDAPEIGLHRAGRPLAFALSIPTVARQPAAAQRFVAFVLSEKGRKIASDAGLPMLDKPWARPVGKVPASLAPLITGSP